MTPRRVRRGRKLKPGAIDASRQTPLAPGVRRQIEDIYLQLDMALTRLGEIQLQFDALRSKIRHR